MAVRGATRRRRGGLEAHQIRAFFEEGFLVLPRVFARHEVARMSAAFDRLERTARHLGRTAEHRGSRFVLGPGSATTPVRIQRIVWCGAAEPVLSDFGRDPRLLGPVAELLGSRAMHQLINQAHFKLPGDEVVFPWHQDSAHRRYGQPVWRDVNGRGSYVQTVTAVDPMTEHNGPLLLVPGSCKHGHVDTSAAADGALPAELIDPDRVLAATLEPGSVLLFGPFTFHCSGPNLSDRPRRVLINGFAYPGANSRVYPGEGAGRVVRAPD